MATTYDEFGAVVEVVEGQQQTDQQNKQYIASGGANDDSGTTTTYDDGSSLTTYANGRIVAVDTEGNVTSTPAENTVNAGSSVAGKSNASRSVTAAASTAKPGKRLENPLGNFSSYTYQITLYMITPDAYDAFIASGRKNINALNDASNTGAGAYVIAQSGGINDTSSNRAPGFDLDFYIDDLKLTTATSGQSSGTSTNVTNLSFTITEPYGFSFISRLKIAAAALADYSKTRGYGELENPIKQNFIIGIRFQGYDQNGKVISAADQVASDTFNPSGNASGVFERFFDISIYEMKFKIDGRATKYNITAATTAPRVAFGIKKGRTHTGVSATARTVEEALIGDGDGIVGIFTQMNQQQQDMVGKSIEIANKYNVKFLGDSADIKNASIVSKFADPDKTRWPMAPVKDTAQVNDKLSVTSTPDNTKRIITFKNDTPITQMVTSIITQSSYLEDALKVIYTTATEPDTKSDSPEQVKPDSKKTIKWYNLAAEVKCLGFDTKVQDFAYEITYIIQPYETPVVVSAYANAATKYYGPHKRYEYWFTGKNSEILKYEQNFNNAYFNVDIGQVAGEKGKENGATGGSASISVVPGMHQPVARLGKLGIGMEAQNSYVTSLVDPGSFAEAKISILGDPDFLINDSPASLSTVYNQFYGSDGYTINANGGQVFIEIDFKEAVDYNNNTGVMNINENILFWKYPKSIAKQIKGVSYQVISVTSSFSKGKFTQELDCRINTFPDVKDTSESNRTTTNTANSRNDSQPNTASDSNTPTGGGSTGFPPDTEFGDLDGAILKQQGNSTLKTLPTEASGAQETAPTSDGKQVQTDDAVNSNYIQQWEESGRE